MFCRKCGKPIDEEDVFCSFCGMEIKRQADVDDLLPGSVVTIAPVTEVDPGLRETAGTWGSRCAGLTLIVIALTGLCLLGFPRAVLVGLMAVIPVLGKYISIFLIVVYGFAVGEIAYWSYRFLLVKSSVLLAGLVLLFCFVAEASGWFWWGSDGIVSLGVLKEVPLLGIVYLVQVFLLVSSAVGQSWNRDHRSYFCTFCTRWSSRVLVIKDVYLTKAVYNRLAAGDFQPLVDPTWQEGSGPYVLKFKFCPRCGSGSLSVLATKVGSDGQSSESEASRYPALTYGSWTYEKIAAANSLRITRLIKTGTDPEQNGERPRDG